MNDTVIDLDIEQGQRISQIDNLEHLHTVIRACRRCQVAGYLEVADPMAFRPIAQPMMLVGQAPGLRATVERVPFSGSGTNGKLSAWFAAAGIPTAEDWRNYMYISAVTKCYPGRLPGAAGDRVPTPTEQSFCRPYLQAQLRLVNPRIIIMVGLLAIQTFLLPLGYKKTQLTLTNTVGKGYTDEAGVRYLPLPHPSGVSRWLNSPEARAQVDRACAILKQWREELGIALVTGLAQRKRKGAWTMAYNMNAAAVTPSSDVSRFLEPGERIVWQGQPGRAGIVNGLQLAGFIVLGVGTFLAVVFMILGITLSGSRQEFNRGGDLGAFLWVGLIIFIVADSVGLILVFTGRVAGGTSKINYIITDRHALITQGPSYNTIRTTIIDLADISIIRLLEGKNGTGSIIFGRSGYNNSVSYNATPSYYDRDYSFVAIADVLSVYNLLRQQQAGLNKQQA